jgi:chromosome segregation ATPase
MQAQKTEQGPCDSLRYMYDQALYFLDSSIGNQNVLQKQLDSIRHDLVKSRAGIQGLLKDKANAKADLDAAKKMIAEQMEQIKKLDAEVKRLSHKSSKQKGT